MVGAGAFPVFNDAVSPEVTTPELSAEPASEPAAKAEPEEARADAADEAASVEETLALSQATLDLAARDVRLVLREQNEQNQMLTTKLNILFVANGALLTSLTISRLIFSNSPLGLAEAVGFISSFSLLMRAFLPRQVAVTPNLEDRKFLETYLALSYRDYQLQMLVNLAETYKANKQRLDDVSQTLRYAAYTVWITAVIMLIHILATYVANSGP